MAGNNGWMIPPEWQSGINAVAPGVELQAADLKAFGGTRQVLWIAALVIVALALPNSQSIVKQSTEFLTRKVPTLAQERVTWAGLGTASLLLVILAAINGSRGVSEFIYFNF